MTPSGASSLQGLSRAQKEEALQLVAERFRRSRPDLLRWSAAFRLERGEPLDFDVFPFQRELLTSFGDRDRRVVSVMKSGQCGVSAAGVSLALYAGDLWSANVVYVLPGFDDAYDFSDTRVRPAIDDSPYLSRRVAITDNKGLKRVGDAFLYFRGSGSERKALSIPADVLVLDEYDRLDQRNVPAFRKRLGAPTSMHLERVFSNPSYPEAGIHALWLDSDQRSWLVTCPACGLEAQVEWDAGTGHYVDEERAARVCGRCHLPLPRAAFVTGRWVPAVPDREDAGYHITKLIVPDENVGLLVREHHRRDEETIQAHYNFDLGLPYTPRGGSLSRDVILACRRDYTPPESYAGTAWVTAGVDVGRVLHVRVTRWLPDGRAAPLYIGEVPGFTDLAQVWARYGVNLGLIDERPEERKAREFMEAHRGRVYLIRWSGDEQRDPLVVDEPNGLVIARRTGACDRLVAAFQGQQRLLPRDVPGDYIAHLSAPHRVLETTSRGQKVARYVSERADHYFFAETHDLLAHEARGGTPIDVEAGVPDRVQDIVRARRRR